MLVLALSCAKVGAPPGGAEDKTGPDVVKHYPESNAVLVSRRMVARLEFSEPVNRGSVEASLFLSPDPGTRLRYRWSGRTLDLDYLDSLETDRTYVISVGSQAKDLRGNPAASTYTLAFSTGERIDRGRIDGWVQGSDQPQSVSLWAYQLAQDSLAAVDVTRERAQYQIQADRDGRFRFAFIKAGRYRVFGVTDRNRDGMWNPPGELIALPPWDVTVTDSTMPWVSLTLSSQDTAPAQVRHARAPNVRLAELRFTHDVRTVEGEFVSERADSVAILDAFADTSGADSWLVFPAHELAAGNWRLLTRGLDAMGDAWHDADTLEVPSRADTARPRLRFSHPASGDRLHLAPDTISIVFTEPVTTDTSLDFVFGLVSLDSDTVRLRAEPQRPAEMKLLPQVALEAGKTYALSVQASRVADLSGNLMGDSAFAFSFSIYPSDSLGTLTGRLETALPGGYLVRVLSPLHHEERGRSTFEGPGAFRMPNLPPRRYLVEFTFDRDADGAFTPGRVQPWQFAEPVYMSPDTVTIRARWEYETVAVWPSNP